MTSVIQQIVDALSVGSTYALLALSLTLVFSVMRLINFAYGTLLVWAAYVLHVATDTGVPFVPAVIVAIVATTCLSILTERIAFRAFMHAPPVTLLITSFGVLLVMQYIAIVLFGESPTVLDLPPVFKDVIHVGGVRVPALEVISIATACVVVAVYYLLLKRTSFGAQIRAAAEAPDITRLMGVKPQRVMLIVFAISGAIAGIVGVLWFAKTGAVTPRSDLGPTLKAFIAVILGGLGNTRGAIIGGLALGGLEGVMSATLPDAALGYEPAIVFALVIAVLIVMPGGLAGKKTEVAR
jgi:branched-chain amino acid transport system permease protein